MRGQARKSQERQDASANALEDPGNIENFKSFRGEHKVGPFSSLTAVVGPNGAGKSCVLKAVCFCLALKQDDNAKEAVSYIRNKEAKSNEPVSVEICFTTKLKSNVFLKRTSGPKEKDEEFVINNRAVSKTHFRDYLAANRLDVFGSCFLFSQGFSDSMIMKSPKELKNLFEAISTSHEYKAQCEELEGELKVQQDDFDKLGEELRNLNKNKKMVSNQLTNCDHYNKISADYDRLETDQILGCLLELDLRLNKSNEEIESYRKRETEAQTTHDKLGKELRKAIDDNRGRKDQSDQVESDLFKKQQDLAFAVERRLRVENKAKELETLQSSISSSVTALTTRHKEIDKDKKAIEAEITAKEEESKRMQNLEKVHKNLETHVQELLKQASSAQFDDPEELQVNNEERRLREMHDRHAREHALANKDSKDLKVQVDMITRKIDLKTKSLNEEKNTLKRYEEEYKIAQEKIVNLHEAQKKAEEFQTQLSDVNIAIEKFKIRLGEQSENKDLLDRLARNVEGFRGELGNLIKPVNDRFRLALSIALGPAKNYLIVKSLKDATTANEILKEMFIQRTVVVLETLPTIKNQTISAFRNECGQLGAAAYDIAEVEKLNQDMEPCLRYFLKNKAVCETIEKAYKLRQQLGKSANVITVGGDRLRSKYIDSIGDTKHIEEEQANKAKIHDRLAELARLRTDIEAKLKSTVGVEEVQNADMIRNRLSTLTVQISQLASELNSLIAEQLRLKRDYEAREQTRKVKEVELSDISKSLDRAKAKQLEIKQKRSDALKKIINEYADKKKITNKNELIEGVLNRLEATVEKEIELRQLITNKKRQIAELGLADIEAKIASAKANLEGYDKAVKENNAEVAEMKKLCDKLRNEIELLTKKKIQSKEEYLTSVDNERRLREKLRTVAEEMEKVKPTIRNYESEFQSCLRRKQQLIDDKNLEGITVPLLRQEMPESIRSTTKRLEEANSVSVDYKTLIDRVRRGEGFIISEELEGLEDESIDQDNIDIYKLFDLNAVVEIRRYLTSEFEKSKKELNSLSTKFVTDDTIDRENRKLSELNERIKELKKKLDDCKDSKSHKVSELTRYKALRNERFHGLYSTVSLKIREVYRRLNRNESADATLTLEVPNDPCSGGLIYQPTPPNKKFIFDSASLSGGEKTLASLALYFAINDAMRSPFLLLDEADAALDKQNVNLVQAYLKASSNSKQIVTVSHNSWFIRRASMLLGITKQPQDKSSSCFSFDLEYFRNAEAQEEA